MFGDNKILDRVSFAAGILIVREGEEGRHAYYIEKGLVEVFTEDDDGNEVILGRLQEDAIFGEMALISRKKRSANIRAIIPTTLIKITEEDFQKSYRKQGKVFRALMKMLVKRVKDSNDHVVYQHDTIRGLEESTKVKVQNVSKNIPKEFRGEFAKEVEPVMERLYHILEKFSSKTS